MMRFPNLNGADANGRPWLLFCVAVCASCLLASPSHSQDGGRVPEPDKEAQGKVKKVIEDTYKDDYKEKSPVKRQAFAQKLLKEGKAVTDDPPTRFVLLREARDFAAETGDKTTAFTAVDEIAKTFSTDSLNQKSDALELMTRAFRSPEAPKTVTQGYLEIIDAAIDADRYDDATNYLKKAMVLAAKDPLLATTTTTLQDKQKLVAGLRTEYGKVASSLKTLKDKPDDANANLDVAKFHCYIKDDWSKGIAYLTKAAGTPYSKVAELEATKPSKAEDQAVLARAWAELAKRLKNSGQTEKQGSQKRAHYWYFEAIRQSADRERATLEDEISKLMGPSKVPRDGLAFWMEPGKGKTPYEDLITHAAPKVNQKALPGGAPVAPNVDMTEVWYPPSKDAAGVQGSGTVLVFIKPDKIGGTQVLVQRGAPYLQDFTFELKHDSFTMGIKATPDWTGAATKGVVKAGEWFCGAATWTPKEAAVYANGVVHASVPFKNVVAPGQSEIRLGKGHFDDAYFKGKIGLVLVYNRALTPQEIFTTYFTYRKEIQ